MRSRLEMGVDLGGSTQVANAVQRPRTPVRFQDQNPSDPEDDEEEIEDADLQPSGVTTSNPSPRSYFGSLKTVTVPYFVSFRHFLNNFSK